MLNRQLLSPERELTAQPWGTSSFRQSVHVKQLCQQPVWLTQVMRYMADGIIRPPKPGELFAGYAWPCIQAARFRQAASHSRCDLLAMIARRALWPARYNVIVLTAEAEHSLDKAPEAVRNAMSRKGGSKVMLVG